MAIVFEHAIEVPQPPARVFALLDDFSQLPQWLGPCEGLAKLGPGPNQTGDKLRYAYVQGNQHGVMDGVILAHEPDSRLCCRYYDRMFTVIVDFHVARSEGGGSHLTHHIEITPNAFMARMMSFLIKGALPKQTIESMEALRRLLAMAEVEH